ncbi:Hypothetical protein PFR_JS8_211 [Propionibacterium freudenreichii]|nr:Hypothetical protein PFR_JS8_211 [Propionibacterium freudenreichii]
MATMPPPILRTVAARVGGTAQLGAHHAGDGQRKCGREHRGEHAGGWGHQGDQQQRHHGTDREAQHGCEGSGPRVEQLIRVDVELHLGVRGQRVVVGQLDGHLPGEVVGDPLGLIGSGELVELAVGITLQGGSFLGQARALRVTLGAHRDVFAGGHAHGSRHETRDAGHEDRPVVGAGTCHAQHQTCGGHHAIVGAQDAGTQPVQPFRRGFL